MLNLRNFGRVTRLILMNLAANTALCSNEEACLQQTHGGADVNKTEVSLVQELAVVRCCSEQT